MEKIEINNLTKKYGNIEVLSNVNLTLEFGQHYLIVGTDELGTEAFFEALSGVEDYEGEIKFGAIDRKNLSNENMKISYIPANPIFLRGSVKKNLNYVAKICGKEMSDVDLKNIAEKFHLNLKQNVKSLTYIEKLLLCFARIEIKKSEILLINFAKNLFEIPKTSGAFLEVISWLNNFSGVLVMAENGQNLALFCNARILRFDFGVFKPEFSVENEINFPSDIFSFSLALKMNCEEVRIEKFNFQKLMVGFSVVSQSDINLTASELSFLAKYIENFEFGNEVEITKINDCYFLSEDGKFLCRI